MIISYDYGHMEQGQDGSASGIVYEYAEVRKYGAVVVNELMRQGHELINCTPSNGPMTLGDSLYYRVNKANTSGSQLHLCFHINAFNGQAHGAEVEVASDNSANYGQSILNEIVKLGFTNRGVNRPNLYVTKNTNMPCVLIEPFFCDNQADVNLYNCNTLGLAIAKGVVNIIGGNAPQKESVKVEETKEPVDNFVAPTGDNITLLNGGGWIEVVPAPDGRIILHRSRSTYISLGLTGEVVLTHYNNSRKL